MKKRLLPALLALVMVLGMLPFTVFADEEPTIPGANGEAIEEQALSTNDDGGKYVTETKEGVALWTTKSGNTYYYTVRGYLHDAALPSEKIAAETGKVSTAEDMNAIFVAAANLDSAVKANSNTNDNDLKATLVTSINSVKDGYAAVKKLDLSEEAVKNSLENLNFLEYFTGLTDLNISGWNLSDLNALAFCKNLKNLTVTGNLGSIAGLVEIVNDPGFNAENVGSWDFSGATVANTTNTQKAHINVLIDALGEKAVGLTEQEFTITAKLEGLTVGDAEITFDADTLEYVVPVSAETESVTITATPASGFKVSKVLYGNEEKDAATALTNIDMSTSSVHVQIVVGEDEGTDPYNYRVYVVKLNKQPAAPAPGPAVEISYATSGPFGGTLTLSGLTEGTTYVVQMAKATASAASFNDKDGACAIVVFTAGSTPKALDVLSSANGYCVALFSAAGEITGPESLTLVTSGVYKAG